MDVSKCVEILKENRMLRNDNEIENFEIAIEEILENGKVEDLYCGFDDKTEDDEVMFGLIHAIESYYGAIEYEQYFSIFIRETFKIFKIAKEWVKVMNIRIINDDESLNRYISVANKCNNEEKLFLREVMKEVMKEDKELFEDAVNKFINAI